MFLEVTWRRAALDNVFGLLPGWWRFTDTEMRKDSALLSRDQWEELLSDLGYRDVSSFISSENPEQNQQACLICRAPDPVEVPAEEETGESENEEIEIPAKDIFLITEDHSGLGVRLAKALETRDTEAVLTGPNLEQVTNKIDELTDGGRVIKAVIQTLSLDHPKAERLCVDQLNATCFRDV